MRPRLVPTTKRSIHMAATAQIKWPERATCYKRKRRLWIGGIRMMTEQLCLHCDDTGVRGRAEFQDAPSRSLSARLSVKRISREGDRPELQIVALKSLKDVTELTVFVPHAFDNEQRLFIGPPVQASHHRTILAVVMVVLALEVWNQLRRGNFGVRPGHFVNESAQRLQEFSTFGFADVHDHRMSLDSSSNREFTHREQPQKKNGDSDQSRRPIATPKKLRGPAGARRSARAVQPPSATH